MGGWTLPRGLIPILLLSTIFFLALLSSSSLGESLFLQEDDFTGTDGTAPDPTNWTVGKGTGEVVEIRNNALRVKSVNDWPGVQSLDDYDSTKYTLLVDWKPMNTQGNMFSFGIRTDTHDTSTKIAFIAYDDYWGWTAFYRQGDVWKSAPSYITNANVGTWYSINITVVDNNIDYNVEETATSKHIWSKFNQATDMLKADNIMVLATGDGGEAYFDNYVLYDLERPPNILPIWGDVPTIEADEDVPMRFDFLPYISDSDGPLGELTISASSPYITDQDGFIFTFVFPEGVLAYSINFTLSDAWDSVIGVRLRTSGYLELETS
jgi:hypothetical protein